MKRRPNILITGTPGTGKSSLAEAVLHNFDGLKHLNISEIIKERRLGDRFNEEWQTWEFDDDKVLTIRIKSNHRYSIVLRMKLKKEAV